MAVMILSVMMLMSFFCFDAVVQSWTAGIEVSDAMGQADYIMEQLVSGLRSAYYPDAGAQLDEYGFQLIDRGEEENALDEISWVKLGSALVGEDCGFAESPHRIRIGVNQEDEEGGLIASAWRVDLQLDEFDPQEDVMPITLSPRVIAFDCRVLDKDQPEKDDEPNWQSEWSSSNSIPKAVELSLYMEPPAMAEDNEPIEIKRIVRIPLWDISQHPRPKDGAEGDGGETRVAPPGGAGEAVEPGDVRSGNLPPNNRPPGDVPPGGQPPGRQPGGFVPGGGRTPGGLTPPGGGRVPARGRSRSRYPGGSPP